MIGWVNDMNDSRHRLDPRVRSGRTARIALIIGAIALAVALAPGTAPRQTAPVAARYETPTATVHPSSMAVAGANAPDAAIGQSSVPPLPILEGTPSPVVAGADAGNVAAAAGATTVGGPQHASPDAPPPPPIRPVARLAPAPVPPQVDPCAPPRECLSQAAP